MSVEKGKSGKGKVKVLGQYVRAYTKENVAKVVREFDGTNAAVLASACGISRAQVLVIVRRARKLGLEVADSVRVRTLVPSLDSLLNQLKVS